MSQTLMKLHADRGEPLRASTLHMESRFETFKKLIVPVPDSSALA